MEEAEQYAALVMDFFGFEDRVIDNLLDREDRQVFYRLQECGILLTGREAVTLPDGQRWRTHYWGLNKELIFQCIKEWNGVKAKQSRGKKVPEPPSTVNIYDYISTDMWSARKHLDI
jgi:hypothetical protein